MNERFQFVYMAHGGWQFRKQAVVSISSLIPNLPVSGAILVYTDRPEEFESLPAEVVPLSKSRIKSWRGQYGYTHRMKIELLRDLFSQGKGHVVFVDSDTLWTKGPEKICESLRGGCPVMHARENELSEAFFPQYLAIIRKSDLLKKAGLPVAPPGSLWVYNSGILGLPSTMNPGLLDEVLLACDFLCRHVPFTMEWVEQVAFSFIYQSRGIEIGTCSAHLIHYWRDNFEFSRRIRKRSQDELVELGKHPELILKLIEEGRKQKRTFWNQLLVRTKRLARSVRKRKREYLVLMEVLKCRMRRKG